MSDELALGLLSAFSAIVVALVSAFALVISNRQKRHNTSVSEKLDVVQHQVKNDHKTNLRDDVDRVERRVIENEKTARNADEMILGELRGMRRDIGRLADSDVQQTADRLALAEELAALRRRLDGTQ